MSKVASDFPVFQNGSTKEFHKSTNNNDFISSVLQMWITWSDFLNSLIESIRDIKTENSNMLSTTLWQTLLQIDT